jgi:hypothetical protein
MADLASVDDLALLLGLTEAQAELGEDLLTQLLDAAEALFEAETGRGDVPFAAAATGRVEILEARRSRRLWLDYPIATVTAIALGADVSTPSETLAPADATKVVWRAGERGIVRVDGGLWSTTCRPFEAAPSFVKVTYNTQDDLPDDAKAAVLRLAAAMYGQRTGASPKGLASETLDNYSVSFVNQSMFADAARRIRPGPSRWRGTGGSPPSRPAPLVFQPRR